VCVLGLVFMLLSPSSFLQPRRTLFLAPKLQRVPTASCTEGSTWGLLLLSKRCVRHRLPVDYACACAYVCIRPVVRILITACHVFRVSQLLLNPKKSQELKQEFLREAHILSSMNHPSVVRMFGVCERGHNLYLVTELLEQSLQVSVFIRAGGGMCSRVCGVYLTTQIPCACVRT